ncbi:VOC family protein (plasmid) [Thioclava sp. 'Guangxiensis']|uniref:VOC family protein n=1 Tax=Thioclava sp. 'Guangxiensis' TaxID=3149044 RepID=UPI0032C40073
MSLFDHLTLKTTRFAKMVAFYEAALAPLGVKKLFSVERPEGGVAGFGQSRAELFIAAIQGAQPTPLHVAFCASNHEEVAAFHGAAVAAGGTDNGLPGLRPKYHEAYFAAFVIDPAGNNVEAVFHGAT